VLRLAVKRSRVPILAGVGTANLDASLELAREARDAGAVGVLLPPPFFYQHAQDEIREFYLEFAAQLGDGMPIYLSHLPGFTTGIAAETARDLLATGQFAGIEDATGELAAAGLPALVARDALFVRSRCAGAPVVSAAACALPELVLALDGAISGGCRDEATRLEGRLNQFLAWEESFPKPVLLKVATGLRGIRTGPLAMPLPAEKQRKLEEFRAWFPAWSQAR
jgi:4-hydroxy-tetrahydrodipicolinate synthase